MNTNGSIHDRINLRGTIDSWARYTVEDWKKETSRLKIGRSGSLQSSFRYQLFFKGNELSRIQFQFRYYGKFVDMGVGKGVRLGDVGELKITRMLEGRNSVTRRRPKKWQNRRFQYNKHRLAEIMADLYGRSIMEYVVESIEV